jgi:hypothetical protein
MTRPRLTSADIDPIVGAYLEAVQEREARPLAVAAKKVGLKYATARDRIHRARQGGLVPPTTPGRIASAWVQIRVGSKAASVPPGIARKVFKLIQPYNPLRQGGKRV